MPRIILESKKLESLMAVTKQIALFEDTVNVGEIDVDGNGNYNAVVIGDDNAVANVAKKYANAANVTLTGKTSDELKSIATNKIGKLLSDFDELQGILARMDSLADAEGTQWHLNEEGDNMEVPDLNYNLFIEDEKYILSMPNERIEFETESDLLRYIVENKLPKLDENDFRMLHAPISAADEAEAAAEADAEADDERKERAERKESAVDYDDIANQLKQHIEQNGKVKSSGSGRKWISDKAALQFIKKITGARGADADRIFAQVIVRLPYGAIFNSPVTEDAAAGVTAGMSIAPAALHATAGSWKSKNKKSRMREAIEKMLR